MSALVDMLRNGGRAATAETLEAVRAVKHIAEAVSSDKAVSREDVRTADRILCPPVKWETLLRKTSATNHTTR